MNPQNTVFHQTFIVKCHLSSAKTKVVLLSDRRVTSWNYPAESQVRVAHQFRVEHCFIAMLLFLVLPIHISFKVFMKKMPFPFGRYFGRCHILRRRKYSVKSDGVEGGGGGRVLHNVLGLKAYTSHFLLSSQ